MCLLQSGIYVHWRGDMNGYGIYVKNTLLDPKHIQNMQATQKTSALWMYLWFLDRVTSIDRRSSLGIVLGGKPFKLDEFDLVQDIKTKRKMFRCLVEHEYLKVTRTPHGHIVWVTKAEKIFGNRANQEESANHLPGWLVWLMRVFSKVGDAVDKQKIYTTEYGRSHLVHGRSTAHQAVGQESERGRSNIDSTVRQYRDRTTANSLPVTDETAKRYLDHWNQVRKTEFSSLAAIKPNLGYWLASGYTIEKILEAIDAARFHHYFRTVQSPLVLLKTTDKSGQPVDSIGEILNCQEYLKELRRREERRRQAEYYRSGGTNEQAKAHQQHIAAWRQKLTTNMSR